MRVLGALPTPYVLVLRVVCSIFWRVLYKKSLTAPQDLEGKLRAASHIYFVLGLVLSVMSPSIMFIKLLTVGVNSKFHILILIFTVMLMSVATVAWIVFGYAYIRGLFAEVLTTKVDTHAYSKLFNMLTKIKNGLGLVEDIDLRVVDDKILLNTYVFDKRVVITTGLVDTWCSGHITDLEMSAILAYSLSRVANVSKSLAHKVSLLSLSMRILGKAYVQRAKSSMISLLRRSPIQLLAIIFVLFSIFVYGLVLWVLGSSLLLFIQLFLE